MGKVKKRGASPGSRLVKTRQTGENEKLDHFPGQTADTICLYQTNTDLLENLGEAEIYREGLIKFKEKFLAETQEWSHRFGLKTEIRVFYTLKPEE